MYGTVHHWIRFLKQQKFIVHDLNYLERKPKHCYYRILYALNKTAYKTKISVIAFVLKYTQIQFIIQSIMGNVTNGRQKKAGKQKKTDKRDIEYRRKKNKTRRKKNRVTHTHN